MLVGICIVNVDVVKRPESLVHDGYVIIINFDLDRIAGRIVFVRNGI